MKKQEFGKLWIEFQQFVSKFNKKALKKRENKTQDEIIAEDIYTVGDGFDSFIAWCKGEYEEQNSKEI